MKKYFFYLQKGLRWSIPFYIIYFVVSYFQNKVFETMGWYLIAALIFICIAGPLWSYAVMKLNEKKEK